MEILKLGSCSESVAFASEGFRVTEIKKTKNFLIKANNDAGNVASAHSV